MRGSQTDKSGTETKDAQGGGGWSSSGRKSKSYKGGRLMGAVDINKKRGKEKVTARGGPRFASVARRGGHYKKT